MNREELTVYIAELYTVEAETPWEKHPSYLVFRHGNNHKWFATLMDIPREKLGLEKGGMLDILNVKCDPLLIDSLRGEKGIFPGYHMNKANWLSLSMDGSVSDERIKMLLHMSFDLTARR